MSTHSISHIEIDLPRRFSWDLDYWDYDESANHSRLATTHAGVRKGYAMLKRAALVPTVLTMAAIIGCHQPETRATTAKAEPNARQEALNNSHPEKTPRPGTPLSKALRNERLKRYEIAAYSIIGDNDHRLISGVWVPEAKDQAKALVFPEQVNLVCSNSEKVCRELKVTLGVLEGMISIMDIDETDWPISSWDARGLVASYAPDTSATAAASDKSHHHVLTMTFDSGAVSTADIPTHEKGCEAFPDTNSYRLARGNYYVDTSPANDMDTRK
jgi:hypothetical protein